MRLYHYLSAKHALEDIRCSRLKVARLDDINDPFELWSSGQRNKKVRAALRHWKAEMAKQHGMLCFSAGWKNPLLWSHYADRHRGICLGFDVDESCVAKINYVNRRVDVALPISEDDIRSFLFTKFSDWSYEAERRCWVRLSDMESLSGYFFKNFDTSLRLCEVIAGPLYQRTRGEIDDALKNYHYRVFVVKARLAFTRFSVVQDKLGFRQAIASS